MLKIGDFSRLAHLSVKTLRHYAEMGLFKPAWTDRFTGYRYYSLDQLPRLNRILALKDLGFSLDQIGDLLDEDLSLEQMRGMLRQKQAELEARLLAEKNRLDMVAARLQQIEQEGSLAGADVVLKRIEPLPVAVLREVAPSVERLPAFIQRLGERLNRSLSRANLHPAGPWLALYPEPEYRERNIPVELGVVVPGEALRKSAGGQGFELRLLPPVEQMACLVHTGPPESLAQAHTGLYAWLDLHRYRPAGAPRELYLRDDAGLPADPFTGAPIAQPQAAQVVEVQVPVERTGIVSNLSSDQDRKDPNMQPKIVNRPAFTVIGYCYHGNNQNQEIAEMWGRFTQRLGEIQTNNALETFGVCSLPAGLPEGHFEYVAGMQVPEDALVPEGMVKRTLPAYTYAVFEHVGPLDTLHQTYQNIHQAWLPQSGYQALEDGLDMEVYDDRVFKDFSPDSIMYIFVPVK
ncbi:MAG TPA: MerR family transcriptional regulator [Anaerolinea sp.]|nr:MerR family transcriptional regulator [Anaerolinea sp.]